MEEEGKTFRGRSYTWGTLDIEDKVLKIFTTCVVLQEHFDFVALRSLLLSSHLQDLKEVSFTVSSHFTFIAGDAQPSL